jgi:hypothetical protein
VSGEGEDEAVRNLTTIKYFIDTFDKGKHLMDGRELDTATAWRIDVSFASRMTHGGRFNNN